MQYLFIVHFSAFLNFAKRNFLSNGNVTSFHSFVCESYFGLIVHNHLAFTENYIEYFHFNKSHYVHIFTLANHATISTHIFIFTNPHKFLFLQIQLHF
jgi:hypothetical protein